LALIISCEKHFGRALRVSDRLTQLAGIDHRIVVGQTAQVPDHPRLMRVAAADDYESLSHKVAGSSDYAGFVIGVPSHDRTWHWQKCRTEVLNHQAYGKRYVGTWANGPFYYLSSRSAGLRARAGPVSGRNRRRVVRRQVCRRHPAPRRHHRHRARSSHGRDRDRQHRANRRRKPNDLTIPKSGPEYGDRIDRPAHPRRQRIGPHDRGARTAAERLGGSSARSRARGIDSLDPHHVRTRLLRRPVAEHLDPACGPGFVHDLCRAGDVVLSSAALPRQPGDGHVNCRSHASWVDLFRQQGYVCLDLFRPRVWHDPAVEPWYAQNCFLFVNSTQRARFGDAPVAALFDVYHPLMVSKLVQQDHRSGRIDPAADNRG
jgi:hypothetical protein